MSIDAIVMMLVAMAIIWGGLAFAMIHLSSRTPSADEQELHRDL